MPLNVEKADNSGRPLRPQQVEALNWLNATLPTAEVCAINAPTGTGKSLIAETLRTQLGARCVVVTNSLMDQVLETYSNADYLKGRSRYSCHTHTDLTCGDVKDLRMPPCEGCVYRTCRKTALERTGVYFNPLSLFFLHTDKRYRPAEYMVIDEVHKFLEMVTGLASRTFRHSKYGPWPSKLDTLDVESWLDGTIQNLIIERDGTSREDSDKYLKLDREVKSLEILADTFKAEPENFVVSEAETTFRGRPEKTLTFGPIVPPASLIRRICDAQKLVILSATMFPHTVEAFNCLGKVVQLDLDSPIPSKQREIRFAPIAERVNKDTPNEDIANWVRKWVTKYPNKNIVVHLTYGRAEQIAPFLADLPITTHNNEDRHEKIEEFKRVGGIFLASACSEGVDLPGDLCRLILVPILLKPYLGDPAVKKRLAKPGGQRWYALKTLETTIQQAGRGARHEKDECLTIIGDPAWSRYAHECNKDLPKAVTSAINWRVIK